MKPKKCDCCCCCCSQICADASTFTFLPSQCRVLSGQGLCAKFLIEVLVFSGEPTPSKNTRSAPELVKILPAQTFKVCARSTITQKQRGRFLDCETLCVPRSCRIHQSTCRSMTNSARTRGTAIVSFSNKRRCASRATVQRGTSAQTLSPRFGRTLLGKNVPEWTVRLVMDGAGE